MKLRLSYTFGLIVLGVLAVAPRLADAQTTAPGPYYATPSWDQTLPSGTRFIVLSNMSSNAVLDRETGLVWERSPLAPCVSAFCSVPDPGTRTWFEAHARCILEVTVGSRGGWRLPTLQELQSLIDYDPANASSPRLPPGHPFMNVQGTSASLPGFARYWSATSFVDSSNTPGSAWAVNFNSGNLFTGGKNISNFVWCVRGGQGVDPQ
jgi:hypothetical protein